MPSVTQIRVRYKDTDTMSVAGVRARKDAATRS